MDKSLSDDERDLLMGLADDAIGQAGGLSDADQQRLGELALRAWSEILMRRATIDRLRAEQQRDAAELHAYRHETVEAAADRRVHDLLAEVKRLRDENDRLQLRAATRSMLGEPDVIVDYMQADADGFITVATSALPAGTSEHDHIVVVGDYDAEPALARVVEIGPERASLRVVTDEESVSRTHGEQQDG